MKYHRGIIRRVDGSDQAGGAALGRFVRRIHDEIEGGFDIGGIEGAPIVEADTAAKMEHVRKRIGSRPGFGEVAVKIHLIISLEQAAEEESVDALGLGIGGEARIEVGGDSIR